MDWSHIQTEFEALVANEEITEGGEVMTFDSVVSGTTDEVETKLSKARTYAQRLDTTVTSSPEGHIFINGKYYVADDVCRHALASHCDTKRTGSERLE
jgi:UDP-glucose:glycoprotein glucosyltransferase